MKKRPWFYTSASSQKELLSELINRMIAVNKFLFFNAVLLSLKAFWANL